MSFSSFILAISFATLLHGFGAPPALLAQTQTGAGFRIAGRVVNAKSGSLVERARVTITDTRNRQRTLSTLTAEDGSFQFTGLPAGKFALEGAKRSFIGASYDQHDQFSTAIVTGAGLDTENLVLRLDPVAVLAGKVLDESGEPVRNANVTVYRLNHFSGISRITHIRATQTDDQGVYEFAPLNAGTYFVSASATPWYQIHPLKSRPSGTDNHPVQVDPSLDVAYPITYYGDTTDSDEATPIPVRGGDSLQADIHLNPVPALHLLLQAPNDRRNGISMPTLLRKSFDNSEQVAISEIQMVSHGLYEVTGIPAGRYSAQFVSNGQLGEATQIDLTTDGQELAPSGNQTAGTLKITVRIPQEATVPSPMVLVLRDEKGRRIAANEVDGQRQVDLGPVPAGRYELMVGSTEKAYSVGSMSTPSGEIRGHFLNVASGAPTEITANLVSGTVNVEGVAKRAGKAASGVMIALVPKDPENNRDLFRRDQSDLDGSFNLRSVIPGTYTVVAIQDGWELDWAEPAVIAQYMKRGETLTVDSKSRGTVRLPNVIDVQEK